MKINSDPNIVPLCDILLVLLIIFMLITPMAQMGLDIQMPDPVCDGGSSAILLSIEDDDLITVNQEPYTDLNLLETRLRDIFTKRHDKTIFVKANSHIAYQKLIHTMDIIKFAGVDTICVVPNPVENDSLPPVPIPVYERNVQR